MMNISFKNETLIRIDRLKPSRPWDFGEISLLLLFVFGTIGNSLILLVMRTRQMQRKKVAFLLNCMAISDIILLAIKFISNMIKLYRIHIYNLCVLFQIVAQSALFVSVWLIVITSIERAIAVLYPIKAVFIFRRIRCKLMILFIIIFFLLISSTLAFCISYSPLQPYYCRINGNKDGACFRYYTYVFPWFKSLLGSWLPSAFIIIINSLIIKALYTASSNRNSNLLTRRSISSIRNSCQLFSKRSRGSSMPILLSSKVNMSSRKRGVKLVKFVSNLNDSDSNKINFTNDECDDNTVKLKQAEQYPNQVTYSFRKRRRSLKFNSKETQITCMLLTSSLVFVLLTFPYSAFELMRKFEIDLKILKNRMVLRFTMFLIDLNHATNFVFYCLIAQQFRKNLKEILIRYKAKLFFNSNSDYSRSFYISNGSLILSNNTQTYRI
jgi:hypothetical protein